jgi:protease II
VLTQQHADAAICLQVFGSIASWAPYDLLERMLYPEPQQQQQQRVVRLPHVLVRAALHDAEVPTGNPVKALARMRRLTSAHAEQQQQQQPESKLLLRVLPGGHLAFERDVKESAFKLAFLLAAAAAGQHKVQQQQQLQNSQP